jgi:hypothetical protein
MPLRVPAIFALLGLFLHGGCTTTLIPPRDVADPVVAYLTDYGRHASLILPRGGGYTEYAFGQWEWFAQGKTGMLRGPLVLMLPGQSTLGRRSFGAIGSAAEASACADGAAAQAIILERERVEALTKKLDARFEAQRESRIEGPGGMEFVKDARPYVMLHNSNGVTADWLRELGMEVRGWAVFSRFRVSEPDEPARTGTTGRGASEGDFRPLVDAGRQGLALEFAGLGSGQGRDLQRAVRPILPHRHLNAPARQPFGRTLGLDAP